MSKFGKIKKNDLVQVLSGREKGKSGKVSEVNAEKGRVYVTGINMVKKAVKKKSQQDRAGIISIEAPLHISKVALVSKGKPSRVGFTITNGKKIRVAKKTGETL